ncbi:hypothetical protein V6N13_017253 [Hibiscus sabdariffa]
MEEGEPSASNEIKYKRIAGPVENEDLWSFQRCLVGKMASICSVSSIMAKLDGWGFGEIRVQRMGGKAFLLSFEDEDLYMMLEDVNWSYLREIFDEVMPWSENAIQLERATWLEISGLPLHFWNHQTIKRVAELWRSFEALGENANHTKDYERVSVLISTEVMKKIEELVEIEVGNVMHWVRVVELGFSDNSGSARKATLEENKEGKSVHVQEDSLSNSFSKSSRSRPSETVAGSKLQVEDETLNTCVIGKERNKSEAANDFGSSRFLGESDLKSNENNVEIPSNNVISSGEGKLGLEQEKCIPDSLNDKEKSKAEKATNGRIEDMAQEVVMVGLDNNPISWANIVSNNLKGHNDGDYLDPTMACNQIVGGAVAVEKPSYSHSSTGPSLAQNPVMTCLRGEAEHGAHGSNKSFWLFGSMFQLCLVLYTIWMSWSLESAIVGGTLFEFGQCVYQVDLLFALATVGAVHTDFGGSGVDNFPQSGHGNKKDHNLSFHHVDCVNILVAINIVLEGASHALLVRAWGGDQVGRLSL